MRPPGRCELLLLGSVPVDRHTWSCSWLPEVPSPQPPWLAERLGKLHPQKCLADATMNDTTICMANTARTHLCIYYMVKSSSLHLQKSIQKLILHKCYMNLAFTLAMQRSTKTTFGAASDRKQSCEGMEVLEPHDSWCYTVARISSSLRESYPALTWGCLEIGDSKNRNAKHTTQPEWG